ncbi:unnamed protein product [Microthlaspi erraticum]|uniref:Uncharacterized protein n=1 Tax=Microthlaspi erraticum TaxID=1685480 RepID=A0A6D2I695_9BRAS|nr:unnamed protein product [Microthlaspi erraticum]
MTHRQTLQNRSVKGATLCGGRVCFREFSAAVDELLAARPAVGPSAIFDQVDYQGQSRKASKRDWSKEGDGRPRDNIPDSLNGIGVRRVIRLFTGGTSILRVFNLGGD